MKYRAVFLAWQEGFVGMAPFPLFNITDPNHEYYKGTVGIATLERLGFGVDEILWTKE